MGFKLGNVVKYLARAGKKIGESEIKDVEKARNYLMLLANETSESTEWQRWNIHRKSPDGMWIAPTNQQHQIMNRCFEAWVVRNTYEHLIHSLIYPYEGSLATHIETLEQVLADLQATSRDN